MEMIKKPAKIDLDLFRPDAAQPPIKYGLPREVVYCRACVTSNQKPNSEREYTHNKNSIKSTLEIDAEGICNACKNSFRKDEIVNWQDRERELVELCDRYRSKDGSYDCLVPGSGGKDSVYQAHMLKYKYGMNPLTVTWAPHIYTSWGWKNFQGWLHSGFDNYLFTPNGRVHRLLTRLSMETIFHPFQPFMFGQMYYGPKMAAKLGISLVFYGENAAEYGNPIEENSKAQKDWKYFTSGDRASVYLGGVSVKDWVHDFGLSEGDLEPYMPADPNVLEAKKVQVHYLGYYLKWHPQANYYFSVENTGFEASPERTVGTYSKYNSIDDKIDDFHYYTTYIKFATGRATYEASQEIRNKEINREEALALVRKYDGEYPERFANEIFDYLSVNPKELPKAAKMFQEPRMTREYFADLCDQFRSPHLWKNEGGVWSLRHPPR